MEYFIYKYMYIKNYQNFLQKHFESNELSVRLTTEEDAFIVKSMNDIFLTSELRNLYLDLGLPQFQSFYIMDSEGSMEITKFCSELAYDNGITENPGYMFLLYPILDINNKLDIQKQIKLFDDREDVLYQFDGYTNYYLESNKSVSLVVYFDIQTDKKGSDFKYTLTHNIILKETENFNPVNNNDVYLYAKTINGNSFDMIPTDLLELKEDFIFNINKLKGKFLAYRINFIKDESNLNILYNYILNSKNVFNITNVMRNKYPETFSELKKLGGIDKLDDASDLGELGI